MSLADDIEGDEDARCWGEDVRKLEEFARACCEFIAARQRGYVKYSAKAARRAANGRKVSEFDRGHIASKAAHAHRLLVKAQILGLWEPTP